MGFNYQLATLFGLGGLPGGGTWTSLVVLLTVIFAKDPSGPLLFFGFVMLFFAPTIYLSLIHI